MEKYRMPIPGFEKYKINLITHEVTNKWGKPVKTRHDSRGRLVVSITKNNGMRTVASVRKIVEKSLDAITPTVMANVVTVEVVFNPLFHCVYHIKRMGMEISEGYIGVSSEPNRRFKNHKTGKKSPIVKYFKEHSDIDMEILFQGTKKECLEQERMLRPTTNMGWNIAIGGGNPWFKRVDNEK